MDIQTLKPYIDWLQANPEWGGFFAFLVAFGESIAVIGLVVPGAVIMSAIGLLVGTGILPITTTLIYAGIGAFLGDLLSFGIGYYYRDHIREVWPFRTVPHWLDKSEKFFADHGGKSIILGRFVGFIRPLLPAIAGSLKMSPLKFIAYDFPAAMVWSPVYMAPGYILGAFSLRFPQELATKILLYSIVVLLMIWLLYWIVKEIFIISFRALYRICIKYWTRWQEHHHYSKYTQMMAMQRNPHYPFPLMILLCSMVSLGLFLLISLPIISELSNRFIDTRLANYFMQIRLYWLMPVAMVIQYLGSTIVLFLAWLGISIWLYQRKQFIAFWHWIIVICIGFGIVGVFMRLFASALQRGFIVHHASMTFPSLEMAAFVLLTGFLNVLIHQERKAKRWLLPTVTLISFILISFCKLYLGLLWFTDLIAATFLALGIVGFGALSYLHYQPHIIHLDKKNYIYLSLAFVLPWLLIVYLEYFFS